MRGQNGVTQQQMLEFLRARQMSGHPQGMPQQQQQQQRQLPFGSIHQLGANGAPSFTHDPSQGLQNAQPQFGNSPGGQNFPNPLQLQALAARNQNAMFSNPGNDSIRQLNLMLAQNQQNQNGVPHNNPMAAFQRLQPGQQQHPQQSQPPHPQHSQVMGAPQLPPGLFPGSMNNAMQNIPANYGQTNVMQQRPPGMMSQPGMQDGQAQQQGPQNPRLSLKSMQEKAQMLKNSITQGEARIKGLQSQHAGGPMSPDTIAEIGRTQKEVEMRRTALMKIMQVVQTVTQNAGNGGGLTLPINMNPPAPSPNPRPRIPIPAPNQSQVGWMPQPGPSSSPAHQYPNSPRPPMANAHPQAPQMSTPQLPPQLIAAQLNQQGQRATPLQVPNPGAVQHAPQPPHGGMANVLANHAQGMAPGQQAMSGLPPWNPLPRPQFVRAYYEQWAPKHPGKDKSILKFDGREIDLYQLHHEVMSSGSYRMVHQKDLWPVIGAKLGFVNFPGTDTEPARAGPALAAHLEHIYKEFLLEFDQQYMKQLYQHRRQFQMQQQKQMSPSGMASADSGIPQQNGSSFPQSLADIKDPKLASELVSYSVLSVAEMQQRGVPPHIIQLVERNREQLTRTLESQRNFAKNIQNANPAQRNVSNPMANGQSPMNGAMGNAQQIPNGLAKPNGSFAQQQPPHMPSTSMPPHSQSQPHPGPSHPSGPIPGQPGRPSAAQMQAAIDTVQRLREENKNFAPTNRIINIPDAQRIEYNAAFENLHRMITDVDKQLPHFAVFMKEEVIRKLILMINAVTQQRELLSGQGPPRYIMPLEFVKQMINQVMSANASFKNWLQSAFPGHANAPRPANGTGAPPMGHSQGMVPPMQNQLPRAAAIPRPPTAQPPHPPVHSASSPPAPPAHTPSAASPPVITGTPILKRPTPKPTADTPAATPTHVAASPQTPKSPKTKVAPKPKVQPKRKASKAVAPAASPAAGPSETKPPATPATPVNAPTPEGSTGTKRPRDEELSAAAAPAAKRIKTEFEEPPSDAQSKRQAEADAVKTDEDAVKFFEQMSSWLNQVSSEGEGQDSLKTSIADSLDEILKAYPDITNDSSLSSLASSSFIDSITIGSSSPKLSASFDPADIFDFTSYGFEEEAGSKAATPDLVPASSSVGPSPGSASETEAHPPASAAATAADTAKIVDPKAEPGDEAMPQELWRAIDGGESAFYNASDGWKWDQPMPAVEQPWAFYASS
ncbi:hypothetical protein C8Q80DRAFT_1164314 [Daedaleopsis nitida]|nr:hypothetical protein C8Q80DRAFT_1164314 [Daedaleopsis nitida]